MRSLRRSTFTTSRLLDFATKKELVAQTGHPIELWPLVIGKELTENGLDICEEFGVAPRITITVNESGIAVGDNGPGLPAETIEQILDFSVRVSSREAYVAPTRGAQGNALKTIIAMPFVLDGKHGEVEIEARGTHHLISFTVDRIKQEPVLAHGVGRSDRKTGTLVRVKWPTSACSILTDAEERFLQIAADYTWLNPHLRLEIDWFGTRTVIPATDPRWVKWTPSDPTSPHWYTGETLERLIAAYISDGSERTVRDFVSEFRGLSGTAKQKNVLEATGLAREPLSALVNGNALDSARISRLLNEMKAQSKPVKPALLGVIGKAHFEKRFKAAGCQMETFNYQRVMEVHDEIPEITEAAFGWCPEAGSRRLVTGVNWAPALINPFRELGRYGGGLDALLTELRAGAGEPVIIVMHKAHPRVEFLDRGKSSAVLS